MRQTNLDMDAADRELLNLVQQEFPLVREPFRSIGAQLGMLEQQALDRLVRLREGGMVRSIGGVFDPAGLGYRSTLAAMHVPDAHLDESARVVSSHPGVSHNYAREHYYNLWFTLSLPADEDADEAIANLGKKAGAGAVLNLPALKIFKLRVYFDMVGESAAADGGQAAPARQFEPLSNEDRRVVRELCRSLPLEQRPFDMPAQGAKMTPEEFLSRAGRLKDAGVMRRFSAALRHHKAGYVANAMTCWKAPPELVQAAGEKAAARREVSHCYERRTSPGWQYNLFAMVHGHSHEECRVVVDAISSAAALTDPMMLYSIKEYKKERLLYFADAA